ncbi:protein serine/threonine phosphatase 2C [Marasmius fiardii PR-910]|nr:protein serine/threonine phosphatase 2C [Marasmius fiardii PR-910]
MSSLSLHGTHRIARLTSRSAHCSQRFQRKLPSCWTPASSVSVRNNNYLFSTSALVRHQRNSRTRPHTRYSHGQKSSVSITAEARNNETLAESGKDPTGTDANFVPTNTSTRPYRFHIAASWAGKPETARVGVNMISVPFPPESVIGRWRDLTLRSEGRKRKRWLANDAGEDFFFVQEMRNGSGVGFGVADGVGGWVTSGVDPSLFAQSLMYHAHRYCRNAWAGEPEVDPTLDYEEREQVEGWELTPYACLDLAYGGVLRERYVEAGSSTACLLTLNASSGLLRSANLGDSGFLIVRSSNVIYKNPIQSHYFNCPKQVTKLPSNQGRKFSRACIDSPSEAETYSTKLRDGDIVIVYTDGLSDNVFESEMVTICSLVARQPGKEEEKVEMMADRIVEYARKSMMSRDKYTPFEKEAARHGMFFRGGKVDDVTVIVALVRETH